MTDWAAIVQAQGRMAFQTAWRILGNASDTEDAVQEAFVDALRLHQQGTRIKSWKGLLRRLAAWRALDILRKRKANLGLLHEPMAPSSSQPDANLLAQERTQKLRLALARLPEQEAEVFSLRYFGDLANQEIAEVLQISAGAVGVALHKARRHLRSMLEPENED